MFPTCCVAAVRFLCRWKKKTRAKNPINSRRDGALKNVIVPSSSHCRGVYCVRTRYECRARKSRPCRDEIIIIIIRRKKNVCRRKHVVPPSSPRPRRMYVFYDISLRLILSPPFVYTVHQHESIYCSVGLSMLCGGPGRPY